MTVAYSARMCEAPSLRSLRSLRLILYAMRKSNKPGLPVTTTALLGTNQAIKMALDH